MVRAGSRRTEKYSNKLDGDVAKARLDHYKDEQVGNYANTVGKQVEVSEYIKSFMSENGLPVLHTNYYILFAQTVLKLNAKHNSTTLFNELHILQDKWEKRGLHGVYLDLIKNHLVPAYSQFHWFRLDHSLLDGDDVLA